MRQLLRKLWRQDEGQDIAEARMSMRPSPAPSRRKRYAEPTLRKLTREQATLSLVGHAYIGHQGARQILEILFPPGYVATKMKPFGSGDSRGRD
jgi:hypothetical protein